MATRQEHARGPVPRSTARTATASVGAAEAALGAETVAPAPQTVNGLALCFASGMWLWLTAWVGRLLVPLLGLSFVGAGSDVLEHWVQGHAFALVALVVVMGVGVLQPTTSASDAVRPAPFLAAAGGGWLAWMVAQALWFPPLTAGAWVAIGLARTVEVVMLGSMFASLARRPGVALALGAGFQLAVLALARLAFLIVG